MFKIGTGRTAWIAVKWNGLTEDGDTVENTMECKVDLVSQSELRKQITAEREGETLTGPFAHKVTKDWRGVGDANGRALTYSAETFDQLLESPGYATAWGQAYLLAYQGQSGIRAKNLDTSPAAGQVAGEASQKPAA